MSTLVDTIDIERRFAWPAVLACFCSAVMAWGFGFYGQSVFLAALRTQHDWSTSLIASATTSYYLFGALLIAVTPELIDRLGPRTVILGGACVLTAGALLVSLAAAPWQLFGANLVMAAGWATTSSTAITNTLALWFDRRRGLAISLALNGASAAGFTVAPALVHLTGLYGLTNAVALIALAMFAVLVPAVLLGLRDAPRQPGAWRRAAGAFGRREVLTSPRFRTVAAFSASPAPRTRSPARAWPPCSGASPPAP
jgi:MFS family permease